MLPPFIIEHIRQREVEERRRQQPRLELPLDVYHPARQPAEAEEDEELDRGVVILDIG